MQNVYARNIPHAYGELLFKHKRWATTEDSRNGPVYTCADVVGLEVTKPTERVLFDPVRDANPFFHVMEFVWMMSGSNDVRWIEKYNRRFREYADPGTDIIHGAYGYRWLRHFGRDQNAAVISQLKENPSTRRAVLSMWDGRVDLDNHNDIPCNTQIMFRYVEGEGLHMLVTNRSNDMIWGMLGANAVHMTLLHELIASCAGLPLGKYKVVTNNLHVYKNMPNFHAIWNTYGSVDRYQGENVVYPYPLLLEGETYGDFRYDAQAVVEGPIVKLRTNWFRNIVIPMIVCWNYHRARSTELAMDKCISIAAQDWRLACLEWLERRQAKYD